MSDGESDDGKRASKKRKASRACDRCNSQHQPCDNATPKCSVCERAGTDCTYNRPIRKRGPRSGYTGQNGERLWSIVLQAKPELEDVVLQILRGGTYGDTGISNMDYYKNNDHQTELVNRFNESRLGRFLQNGESPDLMLPPTSGTSLAAATRVIPDLGSQQPMNAASRVDSPNPASDMSNGVPVLAAASRGSIANQLGSPQDPGDIYLQSEDIRKTMSQPEQDLGHGFEMLSPQKAPYKDGSHYASASPSSSDATHSAHTGFSQNYRHFDSAPLGVPQSTSHRIFEFDEASASQWLDPLPTDTLLNLGFAPGESMAEDFLELCENPDPIETTSAESADRHEDEESVWRRLVMRGRFV